MKQSRRIQLTILIICLFMAAMIGLFVFKMLGKPSLNEEQLRQRGVYLFESPRLVKPFELLNNKGSAFTKADLEGKWTLMFFGYTFCPDVCPTTLALLNKTVQGMEEEDQALRDSTQVVMVSVDPARDTVEQMNLYVPYFNPGFIGVTGDFMKIHALATNLNAPFRKVPGGGENYGIDHSAYIYLLNPRGDFQGFFKPPFTPEKFVTDYAAVRKLFADSF